MQSRVSSRVAGHSLVECSHVFVTATSRCCTLSCWSDRSCTPRTSQYLGRRWLIPVILFGEDTDLGSNHPVKESFVHLLNEMMNKREIHSSLPVGLWVCGWDIHPVLVPPSCSWHAWLNVKLSSNLFPPLIHFLPNRRIASLSFHDI